MKVLLSSNMRLLFFDLGVSSSLYANGSHVLQDSRDANALHVDRLAEPQDPIRLHHAANAVWLHGEICLATSEALA
jgi:hypothetical protein